MALDSDAIMGLELAAKTARCTTGDAILYALCCGGGHEGDLRFVHEDGLRILPSFGQNLCFDDSWLERAGIPLARVVHGGLDLRMQRPFRPEAALDVRPRIAGIVDKGPGKAALILVETVLADDAGPVFTSYSNAFIIGGGGLGGSRGAAFAANPVPERAPDDQAVVPTRPDGPLFFRLLGDFNPLHVLPETARAAGFDRPIMHGANTFGLACHTVLTRFAGGDPARMTRFAARFSGPLYPGEELAFSFWRAPGRVHFKAVSAARGSRVLDDGLAEVA